VIDQDVTFFVIAYISIFLGAFILFNGINKVFIFIAKKVKEEKA